MGESYEFRCVNGASKQAWEKLGLFVLDVKIHKMKNGKRREVRVLL